MMTENFISYRCSSSDTPKNPQQEPRNEPPDRDIWRQPPSGDRPPDERKAPDILPHIEPDRPWDRR